MANDWSQEGPVSDGRCLIVVDDRIAIELTGSTAALDWAAEEVELPSPVSDAEVQRFADLIKAAPEMADALRKLEPYLDAIVCFASDMGEHEPNRITKQVRDLVARLQPVAA